MDISRAEVTAAVAGDAIAMRRIVDRILPTIRVQVARVLYRYRGQARRRTVEQETDDLTQEVLVTLFEQRGRVLSSWDPDKGLPLVDFVRLVAGRTAGAILKSGARTPWRDDPVDGEWLAAERDPTAGPDTRVASMDLAERVYETMRAELSPLGFRTFQLFFVEEAQIDAVCAELGLSHDAAYAWKSRLQKRVRALAHSLGDEAAVPEARGAER